MTHRDHCEECQKIPEEDWPGTLHVYGQQCWHDEAYIVGDIKSLVALRAAIDKALQDGTSRTGMTVADGEGYVVHVVRHETARMDKMALPYQDYPSGRGRYPASLVNHRGEEGDEILADDEWFAAQRGLGLDYEK